MLGSAGRKRYLLLCQQKFQQVCASGAYLLALRFLLSEYKVTRYKSSVRPSQRIYNPLVFRIRIYNPPIFSEPLKSFVSFDFNRTFILSNQISISMDTANQVLDELYFVTSTVVDWIDIFTRPKYKHIILESLAY